MQKKLLIKLKEKKKDDQKKRIKICRTKNKYKDRGINIMERERGGVIMDKEYGI